LDSSLPRDRNIVFRVFRCCESAGLTSCQYTSVQLSKIIWITNVLQTCPFTNSLQYRMIFDTNFIEPRLLR
jgi:hypothetical protein